MANLIKVNGGKSFWPTGYEFKSTLDEDKWPGFGSNVIPLTLYCHAQDVGASNHDIYTNLGTIWTSRQVYTNWYLSLYTLYSHNFDKLKSINSLSSDAFSPSVCEWLEKSGGGGTN